MTNLQPVIDHASLLERFDARLAAFFSDRLAVAARYGGEYHRLWSGARDASDGGKRLRPRLVLSAFDALGGTDRDAALDVALAFELLHTAFLLHDDVIDADVVRRGRPNLSGTFSADALRRGVEDARAARWGESAAILAGDLLLHAAASLVARVPVGTVARTALLDVLDHSIFVSAAGELADVSFAVGMDEARLPDVLAMTERKTSAYSFAGPLSAGAILAGAGGDALAALDEYGRMLGIAFQLGDDLLGVFGDEAVTGKSVLGDLRQGKQTSLIAYARATRHWRRIQPAFGRPDLPAAAGRRVAALLEECGARHFVELLLTEHTDAALAALQTAALPAALREELADVAQSCIGRLS